MTSIKVAGIRVLHYLVAHNCFYNTIITVAHRTSLNVMDTLKFTQNSLRISYVTAQSLAHGPKLAS